MGLNLVFGRAFHLILMHLFCYIQCFEISFQKISFFSLKSCFFQNFDWSNLIFDQSKSCFKNSVSLYLVRLIELVFRSIEDRISGFLKQFFDYFKTSFFKKAFQLFFSLQLGKDSLQFFCRFPPKFLQGFPPSKPVRPFYPSFWFYFHVFMHIFMHLKDIFRNFWDLGFLLIQGLFSEIDHWVSLGYCYIHVCYWLFWSIWGYMKNWKF